MNYDDEIQCPWCASEMCIGGHREKTDDGFDAVMSVGCPECAARGPTVRVPITSATGNKEFDECHWLATKAAHQRMQLTKATS